MSLNFVFIGAGNLATHLSKALQEKGNRVSQVYSRSIESAKQLAEKLNTNYTTTAANINLMADVYIIALKDAAFSEVLPNINFKDKFVVHCSGSLPLSVLNSYSLNVGVFYPLQTFSKQRNINFSDIPIFIEANSDENTNKLLQIGKQISNSVVIMNSEKRKYLHIAAVFACNFVNHLYAISSEILGQKGIPFDVLKPLILETALKIREMEPEKAQTGPAIRFDDKIISAHIKELEETPEFAELYKLISKSIFEFHKQTDE